MSRRSFYRLAFLLTIASLALAVASAGAQDQNKRGRKYKPPPPTAQIEVTVLRDFNQKPLVNAAVVFHPMEGGKDRGAMELKTNDDGKTVIDVIPVGDTVRLQIIAKGYQTFGQDYKVDKDQMAILIRMKRPGQQYSIYEKHDKPSQDAPKDDKSAPAPNPPATSQPQPK